MRESVLIEGVGTIVNDLADPTLFEGFVAMYGGRPFIPRRISVTQLLGPAQIRRLYAENWENITVYASDLWFMVLGTAFHKVLEEMPAPKDDLREHFMQVERDGWTITGTLDHYVAAAKAIKDYKLMSVWEVIYGLKPDKEQQLNLYKHLFIETSDLPAEKLAVSACCRDWSKTQAGDRHPSSQDHFIRVPVWEPDACEGLLMERLRLHQADEVAPCTPAEQWRDEDFAIMKPGRKSAVRKFDTKAEAETWLEGAAVPKATILHRVKGATRCDHYCPVRDICPQRKEENR